MAPANNRRPTARGAVMRVIDSSRARIDAGGGMAAALDRGAPGDTGGRFAMQNRIYDRAVNVLRRDFLRR